MKHVDQRPPPTILDKWRRKGIFLANMLDDKIEKSSKKIEDLRAINIMKSKEIKKKENDVAEERRNILALNSQLKSIETENSVNERHIADFFVSDQHSEEIFQNIINVGQQHSKNFINLYQKYNDEIIYPIERFQSLLVKIKSFSIPKAALNWKAEEEKSKKLRSILTTKQKELDEHEADQSIYSKLIESYKKLNQLQAQYKAIEDAKDTERKERQKEDELKKAYQDIIDQGRSNIKEEEKKLKKNYEETLAERNNLTQQINSLQRQLERYNLVVQQTTESNQEKIHNYTQTIQKQEDEILEMEEKISEMESKLRFDAETNTEPEKPKYPSMNPPKFPSIPVMPPVSQTPINPSAPTPAPEQNNDNYKSSLYELLQRANQVYHGNFK
ncbi:hypothetical protein TRFO_09316 [Tritrichomonas foetus]|uniref:Uncharacterized protein n=1 Tax=Tritrichomonas foetus TaxID=1144522 RepID=A0A1J4JEN7_9EUKA|nr:hypothetical protein TRFO_09316 [Tritrichomonas foetus]|eukprot:OHS97618.1 hypothetical protein TRFO_09316 [Tritrichomonas foetus]